MRRTRVERRKNPPAGMSIYFLLVGVISLLSACNVKAYVPISPRRHGSTSSSRSCKGSSSIFENCARISPVSITPSENQHLAQGSALFATSRQVNNGRGHDNDIGNSSKRKRALAKFLSVSSTARTVTRKAVSKARSKLHAMAKVTRRKRRNMLAAAAMMLSLFAMTSSHDSTIGATAARTTLSGGRSPEVVKLASSRSSSNVQNQGNENVLKLGKTKIGRRGSVGEIGTIGSVKPSMAKATRDVSISKKASFISRKSTPNTQPPLAVVEAATEATEQVATATKKTLEEAITDLRQYLSGPKSDTLLLLLATALVTPLCKQAGISPILGFLAAGMMLGPNAAGLIKDVHNIETMAELGIVFFLFEMGIELSVERLTSMKKDVFGLGLTQFLGTAAAIAAVGKVAFNMPGNALVVLGGGLALSSSAFVLQLLKDKEQLSTRFGKASFGILLLQDLAVVPLLVVTPILAGGGQGLGAALGSALVKATIALSSIAFTGKFILNPLFNTVAKAKTQEAFLGVILLTVLGMSFMTEGLGLSNTLGAFLAGVLLSETKYRYQIEADIAPFRGILLGLFFVTVGFEIDVGLVLSQLPLVTATVLGIILVKAAVACLAGVAFGLSLSTSVQTALIVSQAGEFAFVTFGLAKNLGMLNPAQTKFLLTSVSLTMALTPFLASLGGKLAKQLEEGQVGADGDVSMICDVEREAEDRQLIESDDFVIVVGFGICGKLVADLLQMKFIQYECLEVDVKKAAEARARGLPVFYGDIARPEIAEAFKVGKAKAVIVTISDRAEATRVVIALRRQYPDLKIFARASDADHAQRLQETLDVIAMVPIVPEDNVLLTLPFGGAVLKSLGAQPEEVNAILESKRKAVLDKRGLAEAEDEATLMELGITTEEERTEALNKMKEKSPMVAQVIEECSACPPDAKDEEQEVEEDEELVSPSDESNDTPVEVGVSAESSTEDD